MLALVLPLLSWITPQYEATGVSVAPLAPALAVALAGVSLWGWRALPAVALGALAAAFGWPIGAPDPFKLFEVLTLVMQAAFGGMLLRRSGRTDDSALDTLAALRRLIAAALACGIIGALMRVVADLVWSTDPTLRPGTLALVRATADAASVVLLMPVLMAVFSPLRERWRMRRRTVAVPLLVVAALMLVAFAAVEDRDRQQAQQRFERDAEVVYSRTQALLDAPVHALQAMQGAFNAAAGGLTSTQFDNLARVWVKRSLGMGSIGWLEAPTRPVAPGAAASPAPPPDEMRPLTLRHAIGAVPISVLELPAVRQSVVRAIAQDEPVVSAPLALGTALDARSGVILLQNLPNGSASSAWLAFAVVSPDALVAPIVAARADALRACLYDTDSRLDRRRLAGAAGCETALPADHLFTRETAFVYAGRRWTLRTSQPVRTSGGVWLFALPALGGGALFAMLLSGMTGQVQRVRGEARSRTDELRHEIDERARTLAVHERTVHTLMDTVQIGMALIDPEGRIRRVNTALAE